MSEKIVFDSFAILSFFKGEKSSKIVQDKIEQVQNGKLSGFLTTVNLAEIYYIIWREKGEEDAETAAESIKDWGIKLVSIDENLAKEAGSIKANHPLSLADAFAAAVTKNENATLLTGDSEFKLLDDLSIQWL